jgi:hypothetical protein
MLMLALLATVVHLDSDRCTNAATKHAATYVEERTPSINVCVLCRLDADHVLRCTAAPHNMLYRQLC